MIFLHCLSASSICAHVFECVKYVCVVLYDFLYLRRVKLELGEGVIYDSVRKRGVNTKMLRFVT